MSRAALPARGRLRRPRLAMLPAGVVGASLMRWKPALAAVVCLSVAPIEVRATPPAGGITPIESIVAGGCNIAESVAVVRIADLEVEPIEGGEAQTATLDVVRMIRGNASDIPERRVYRYSVPPMTDSFPTIVRRGAEYVMFFSRTDPRIDSLMPSGLYADIPVEQVVALTVSACGGGAAS